MFMINGKVDDIEEIDEKEFDDIQANNRNKALIKAFNGLAAALNNKDDKAIIEAIKGQPQVFKESIELVLKSIPKPETPEVNVTVDYQNLVTSFKEISNITAERIEESNNKVIEALESRLLPDSFELIKNYGVTQSVKVNYKQANQINNNKK